MPKRIINFPIAALIITVLGALSTFAIIDAAESADQEGYGNGHAQQIAGEVPTISEQLEDLKTPEEESRSSSR